MNQKISRYTPIFLMVGVLALSIISCVEEYWPELSDDYGKFLIIEGRITNEPGPYTVKISMTNSLDSIPYARTGEYDFKGLRSAIVNIHDDDGNTEQLTEIRNGIYQTAEGGLQGVIGKKYQLTIVTQEGKSYESTFEELLEPTEIEDFYFTEEQTQEVINNEEIINQGLRFKVTSMEAPENSGYFFWELEETYEYHSAYEIEFIFEGEFVDGIMSYTAPYRIASVPKKDALFYCWNTKIVHELFATNVNQLSVPKVVDFPLNFISYDNKKMDYGYNLLLKQYTVSKNAHEFLQKMIDQNKSQEGLYSSQPYQIRGNITNTESPLEPVLGYFITASKSEGKRIQYIAPFEPEPNSFRVCKILAYNRTEEYVETDVLTPVLNYILKTPIYEYPIYLTHAWVCYEPCITAPRVYHYVLSAVGDECVDCRIKGGTIIKPDFWEN